MKAFGQDGNPAGRVNLFKENPIYKYIYTVYIDPKGNAIGRVPTMELWLDKEKQNSDPNLLNTTFSGVKV